jgi:hypothetical protein
MVHVELAPDLLTSVVLPSDQYSLRSLVKARRAIIDIEGHALRPLAYELLDKWLQVGFIASTACGMVSLVGGSGVVRGFAPLVPGNGIPVTMVVGKVVNGKSEICFNLDHRVYDGSAAGIWYDEIGPSMKRYL